MSFGKQQRSKSRAITLYNTSVRVCACVRVVHAGMSFSLSVIDDKTHTRANAKVKMRTSGRRCLLGLMLSKPGCLAMGHGSEAANNPLVKHGSINQSGIVCHRGR